jgi:hypothetical protein
MALTSGARLAACRLLAVLAAAGVVLMAMALSPPRRALAASGVQVFVGYADTLRSNAANFPTPWAGSPSVIFSGCTGCQLDAGAARVVNTETIPVTVDSVVVTVGTCVFDIWTHDVVLQPGQQFVVTQTNGGVATSGCPGFMFDTSDVGPNGTLQGGCTPDGVIPLVDVMVDGVSQVLQDTGQVLNTKGIDLAACPSGTNESEQWTLIGGTPCVGATLALAPASQTQVVGSTATVQATLRNGCGQALSGAVVSFAVQSGPNTGVAGTGTTDGSGVASFSYPSAATGTDTLGSSVSNPAGTITSNTVSVTWVTGQAFLAVSGATADFHDPATVSGVLSDSRGPLAGRSVTLTLNGAETCSATTDATGTAACSLTPGEAAGSYPLTATFGGDATHLPATGSAIFAVTREETALAYTGPARAANGASLTLSGVLREDGTAPIAGRTVTFTLGTGAPAQSCSGITDAGGRASCTIESVSQPDSTTSAPVSAVFAGDAFYLPASASATVRFQFMTGHAFGLSAGGLVNVGPLPDTGDVATAGATTVAPPCVLRINGLVSAHDLCASVVTSVAPGTSTATASLQDVRIGLLLLPVISIQQVSASSRTTCAGSSGGVSISSITIGGVPINVANPGPNTTVTVLGVTVVLNEQLPVPGADQGLTVNAVHISVAGLLDVIVSSATSDIHNC